MSLHYGRALVVSFALLLTGCEEETEINRGAKGVCEALRGFGVQTVDDTRDGGYACHTQAAGTGKAEWRDITVTAYAPPANANTLEGVLLEGRYPKSESGRSIKSEMVAAATAIFSRLDMDIPPGLTLAIHTHSQSEVTAGKLRVNVDHRCEAGDASPCRIRIHIRNSEYTRAAR